ncbi:MAG: Maf family nucleotide pyrophosphatase [Pseudomonadales bacterium]|nr:Maf family nucleotide pyrophosphatase [Pseudomonadales bacterium]
MHLILASSSTYRAELLQKLRLPFIIDPACIDESSLDYPSETAAAKASRLAIAKAKVVGARHPQSLIIGSDQIAVCDGTQLGKPGDYEASVEQLKLIRGKAVTFQTGICLYNTTNGSVQAACETYSVHLKQLTNYEIEHYVRTDEPFDCAGSFRAESLGIALFDRVSGDDPNTLIGLPIIRLVKFLHTAGVNVLAPQPFN